MPVSINNYDIKTKINKEISDIKLKYKEQIKINSNVKDLTHLKTYTIDDSDSLEIDDAISIEKIGNNYKLWVHIASPAAYIGYGTFFDKKARKISSTLYLCKENIYMFPDILIQNIFSLNQNEKRASISLGVTFGIDGSISNYEIVQSLVKPNYQLNYDDADELIDYAPKEEEDLHIISKILEKRKCLRKKLGAKEILESSGKIILINNKPTIKVIVPTLSRLLVSESMILFGDIISKFTKKNNIPVPYRVQEINSFKFKNDKFSSENKILNNYLLKKSMGKTYYSIVPMSHNSLGLKSYLHATSPIRRYSDLLVHYQICRFINNKPLIDKEEINRNIDEINNLTRQNINKYREDQSIWKNKWFENNKSIKYKVVFLNWIHRYKNICIIYFVEYSFSSICRLKSKYEVNIGDMLSIKDITIDYNDMLYFELNI